MREGDRGKEELLTEGKKGSTVKESQAEGDEVGRERK